MYIHNQERAMHLQGMERGKNDDPGWDSGVCFNQISLENRTKERRSWAAVPSPEES